MTVSSALYTLAALGLFVLAGKYGLAKAPLDYHRTIVEQDGTVSNGTRRVIEVLYRVWAGSLAAFGICLLALVWGVAAGEAVWVHVVILLAVAVAAVPSIVAPRSVEMDTGVRTPWRLALGLAGLVGMGFMAWLAGL